ncbi:MAG: C39 family peptidase [Candidatus Obscuribacterales bacterium]|nr:C39 family peptidase [Candidatus Obscuribacterales bacterium]
MRPILPGIQLLLLAVLLQCQSLSIAATSAISKSQTPSGKPEIKLPANLIPVPLCRQAKCYTCGVAALQSILAYNGQEIREDDLEKKLKSTYKMGTAYQRIADYAEKAGLKVEIHKNMTLAELKAALDKNIPVLILLQAWGTAGKDYRQEWEDGHYVVAVAYDEKNLFFMDPSTIGNYTYIPQSEFIERWHDTDYKEKLFNFGMYIWQDKTNYKPDIAKFME